MIVPGYPDGVDVFDLLHDLRFVKIPAEARQRVMWMIDEYRSRSLSLREETWVRSECRKRVRQIRESHQLQGNARITDAKHRVGSGRFEQLQKLAKENTRAVLTRKLEAAQRVIEATVEEQKDLGI